MQQSSEERTVAPKLRVVKIAVTVPENVRDRIEVIARREMRSLSSQVGKWIADALPRAETQEASA